jgi:hypothetical protein
MIQGTGQGVSSRRAPPLLKQVEDSLKRSLEVEEGGLGTEAIEALHKQYCHLARLVDERCRGALDQKVTLRTLFAMRKEVLALCLDEGWLRAFVEGCIRTQSEPAATQGDCYFMFRSALEEAIEDLEESLSDLPAFCNRGSVSEAELMRSDEIGLSEANKVLYLSGALHLRELFATQPLLLLRLT